MHESNRQGKSAWYAALLTSTYASILALGLMFWARSAVQLRTLPERLMEAVLRLVPPDQFEAVIDRYGPSGKEYALYATTVCMFLGLFIVGLLALRLIRRPAGMLVLGLALYLAAVVVIAPLTGAGFFATALFTSPLLSNAIYFGSAMAYATMLLLGRWVTTVWLRSGPISDDSTSRRALLAGVTASVASFAVSLVAARSAGRIYSSLPLASIATSEPVVATPVPTMQATAAASLASAVSPAAAVSVAGSPTAAPLPSAPPVVAASPSATAAVASPTPVYPEPPPERALARDKDGTLLAVKRTKGQLQPMVQSNDDFYVVSKNAGGDPVLNARDWRLIVDGAVNRPVQLDYLTLRKLPSVSVAKTLECISNLTTKCDLTSFGCDLISTAQWKGARLRDVLDLAGGIKPEVVSLVAFTADEYSSALPAEAANDPDVLLVYEMNGTVLPREHGFPVRLLTPDRYGLKSAKWVVNVKAMAQPVADWWGQRNWSLTATVKTLSRIDVPMDGAELQAGAQRIAGIAYAGTRGISKVEFSSDGGETWKVARLTPGPGKDTFWQWEGVFTIAAGTRASLVSRATDGLGQLQVEQFSLPQPNGGTGWDTIAVKAV